jgi:hypothetical protein
MVRRRVGETINSCAAPRSTRGGDEVTGTFTLTGEQVVKIAIAIVLLLLGFAAGHVEGKHSADNWWRVTAPYIIKYETDYDSVIRGFDIQGECSLFSHLGNGGTGTGKMLFANNNVHDVELPCKLTPLRGRQWEHGRLRDWQAK